MATVSARLRGGPYDNLTVDLDANDPNNPPDLYEVSVRGPHEVIVERCEYRRAGREHDGQSNADVWVYEAADCTP
jgi:hypothetical protein